MASRILDDNPVLVYLREKFKGEDYGDTCGEIECVCIDDVNYKFIFNLTECHGENSINFVLKYRVNLKEGNAHLDTIKIINSTIDGIPVDDYLIER